MGRTAAGEIHQSRQPVIASCSLAWRQARKTAPHESDGMPKQKITGSFVALITPFNKDGSVDFAAFRSLLHFQEQHGTAAVLIMGSTGETSMLVARGKEENHRRDREDEDGENAGLLRLHRQQHRGDDRQRALRRGQRRRRRDPCRAGLYLRAGGGHRALLPRCCRCHRSAARHLQQSAAGEERPALGPSAAHLQASELRGAQGIDRAGRPGGAGARRQAGCLGHVLRQPQSRPRGADHEPRRPRHGEHDRQHRAGRARHRSRRRGRATPRPRTSRPRICGSCRSCISPIRRSIRSR